jgi:MFS family permease
VSNRAGMAALAGGYLGYGAFWGAWVVLFADFLHDRAISPGRISLGFGALSIVAIGLMIFVAPRLERRTRNSTVSLALFLHATGALLVAWLPNDWLLVAFFFLGSGTGLIDVFVNAAGQQIEERAGAPVLQWVHAAYGVGGLVGALLTGIMMTLGAPYAAALVAAGAVQLAAGVLVHRSSDLRRLAGKDRGRVSLSVMRSYPELVIPALIVMCAFYVEGSMDVWSVIFLRETLSSSILGGAAAFAAFSLAMTLGRSFAARVLFGFGYKRTVLASGLGSLAFALLTVTASSSLVAGLGFLGLGFSLAAAAPAAFGMTHAAGPQAGLAVGAMTAIGYAGFVVGPPIMGWLADNAGLRAAMSSLLAAALGMALLGALTYIRGYRSGRTPPSR